MHWIKVTRPEYEQSKRYAGQVGEVVGRWGPENSEQAREGYLVEFADGEIIGVTDTEVDAVDQTAQSEPHGQSEPTAEVADPNGIRPGAG